MKKNALYKYALGQQEE
ncbi:hypothetical protein SEEN4900_03700 [Salmonella enterica subsp. enterica serovar Newport str. WA_14900]|nr:hypothetical protein SEEN4900_03700 [Salmonella enterica subsp. enterica serovar Newport str. WA_14900]